MCVQAAEPYVDPLNDVDREMCHILVKFLTQKNSYFVEINSKQLCVINILLTAKICRKLYHIMI